MHLISRFIFYFLGVLILGSCSGGQNTPSQAPSIQSNNLFYGVNANFFVGITSLKDGVKLDVTNCLNFSPTTSPNPLYLAYSCIIVKTGEITFSAKDDTGNLITSKTFVVPKPQVKMTTNLGDIVFELSPNEAPSTVNNFLKYVQDGFYTNTIFHRVIPDFVAQGGGFSTGMIAKPPTYSAINLESQNGLLNVKGSIAMARTSDPNSATSQFFINLVDNAFLNYSNAGNPGYTVFGRVLSGQNVVDQMATFPTISMNGYSDVPSSEIIITSMYRTQ